jgi:hypothetical protein
MEILYINFFWREDVVNYWICLGYNRPNVHKQGHYRNDINFPHSGLFTKMARALRVGMGVFLVTIVIAALGALWTGQVLKHAVKC